LTLLWLLASYILYSSTKKPYWSRQYKTDSRKQRKALPYNMKFLGTAILTLLLCCSLNAQQKDHAYYALPKGVTTKDYVAGKVLVKVKPGFVNSIISGASNARSAMRTQHIKPMVPSAIQAASTGRLRSSKSSIDLSQYFEIDFDASVPIEQYINQLHASGYIEYAEPVFSERLTFTPNDPLNSSQYYLDLIRAYEAWEITKGSEEIIIGIIDSGVDIDHPDLVNQLYINDDPVNGVDDDGNGYIDDYRGWDFSGDDTLNIYDPNFIGDNNPAIFKYGPGFTHGTAVGACASASTDNGVGMSGVGNRSKLLFTKHFADNQLVSSTNYNSNLYYGIIYAAQNGARIINCSWGSSFRSQVYQDIITLVTLDYNCLVVAAAGNDGVADALYPAAYDYVLSVAATNASDQRASFSNYGNTIDISAPGVDILTAEFDNNYESQSGTSFSSPIVAGAAALVLAHRSDLTPLQVGELLRVSADESFYTVNGSYVNKLGKGRLDIAEALASESPSIRALNYKLVNDQGLTPLPGQKAYLSFDFTNFLSSTTAALTIKIQTTSTYVALTKASVSPGAIAGGTTVSNAANPFELTISNTVPTDEEVSLLITYEDGAYNDYQTFAFIPNPSFRNIDDNLVTTSISSNGRLGYSNPSNASGGNGFVFNDQSILFEMGLMMGSSSSTILNNVRNGSGGYDTDFNALNTIQEIIPGERSYAEIFGDFSNSTEASAQKVRVNYRSMVWREAPYDKFVIVEYTIKNPTASTISNFHFGIFADWDISFNGAEDAAGWNAETNLGYVYPKQSASLPHAGVQLLTSDAKYYAIDNDQSIGGNPFGVYDGYTTSEKFTSLSTNRLEAGNTTASGNDVSHVVSSGPHTLAAGQEITIAFALHGANNFGDLLASAKYADSLYNFTLNAPLPTADTVIACYGADATLTATGASKFKWYQSFTGGESIGAGSQFIVPALSNDTTFYVSNADESYESLRVPVYVDVQAQPHINASSLTICGDNAVTLSVDEASSYLWSNGATTRSIDVVTPGAYSVVVNFANEILECESSSETVTLDAKEGPQADFMFDASANIFTGVPMQFNDESTDAVSWSWDFGDDEPSNDQNPLHTFEVDGSFSVTLQVTSVNGCQDAITKEIVVILGVETMLQENLKVYPNPTKGDALHVSLAGIDFNSLEIELLDTKGQRLFRDAGAHGTSFSTAIVTERYSNGIYFLKVKADNKIAVRKVLISK
jgi:serine protease